MTFHQLSKAEADDIYQAGKFDYSSKPHMEQVLSILQSRATSYFGVQSWQVQTNFNITPNRSNIDQHYTLIVHSLYLSL